MLCQVLLFSTKGEIKQTRKVKKTHQQTSPKTYTQTKISIYASNWTSSYILCILFLNPQIMTYLPYTNIGTLAYNHDYS